MSKNMYPGNWAGFLLGILEDARRRGEVLYMGTTTEFYDKEVQFNFAVDRLKEIDERLTKQELQARLTTTSTEGA